MTVGRTPSYLVPPSYPRAFMPGFFVDVARVSLIVERLPKKMYAAHDRPRIESRFPFVVVTVRLFHIRMAIIASRWEYRRGLNRMKFRWRARLGL